jgi:hypothetical protein
MNTDWFIAFSQQLNEVLTAATVIVAVSMLLYNITHGPNDSVVRVSSILLGCVSIIYVGDVMVSIARAPATIEGWLRIGWIGIAFAPAALFHLSDALLATTGLKSRGRRRRVVRLLYLIGVTFLVAAAFTDLVVHSLVLSPIATMQPGPLLPVYIMYFVVGSGFAFNNVLRARRRCLTRTSHRRMTYLLFALVTPVAGVFPYSLLFPRPSTEHTALLWGLINLGNLGIVLMLAFMAYPLSFFGPRKPDRLIKAELLSFMLRGPVIGIAVLAVILYVPRLNVFGFPTGALMPFAAVTTVLALQWFYTIAIPWLERKLIYTGDQEQVSQLKDLSEHLLTRTDARQLIEVTLAAVCDYLRVPSAFVAGLYGDQMRVEQTVGPLQPSADLLNAATFTALLGPSKSDSPSEIVVWQSFWVVGLYSTRGGQRGRLIGVMGVWARSAAPDLQPEEQAVFRTLYTRAARTLEDLRIVDELYARLEDLMESATAARTESGEMRYGNAAEAAQLVRESVPEGLPTAGDGNATDLAEAIRDALRDYWGGPRLTDERLLGLHAVEALLPEVEGNPAKAVRQMLLAAVERLKPDGPRSLTASEWTLYNILDLRFIQGKKVREVARQLAMSEADLYRKQRVAIERVAQAIIEGERHFAEARRGEGG